MTDVAERIYSTTTKSTSPWRSQIQVEYLHNSQASSRVYLRKCRLSREFKSQMYKLQRIKYCVIVILYFTLSWDFVVKKVLVTQLRPLSKGNAEIKSQLHKITLNDVDRRYEYNIKYFKEPATISLYYPANPDSSENKFTLVGI